MFSPISSMIKLKSLRINSCERCFDLWIFFFPILNSNSAFSNLADGSHSWLSELKSLEELNLARTTVTARMLPPLQNVKILDLSFSFVSDIAVIVDQLQSVERLAIGNDEDAEISQLQVVPRLPFQLMPNLRKLKLFLLSPPVEGETVVHLMMRYRALSEWAARKKVERVTVFVSDLGVCETDVAKNVHVRIHRHLHDISDARALEKRAYQAGWRLHQFAEQNLDPKSYAPWVRKLFSDLLECVQYYRFSPAQLKSKKSTICLLIAMLTLLARFDHTLQGCLVSFGACLHSESVFAQDLCNCASRQFSFQSFLT